MLLTNLYICRKHFFLTPEKRELVEASFNRSETLKFYNASLIECETDYVSIKIPKQEMMTRKHGMFNGAMIASLVDVSSGYTAVSHYDDDCYVVTVELKVNFHPSPEGCRNRQLFSNFHRPHM